MMPSTILLVLALMLPGLTPGSSAAASAPPETATILMMGLDRRENEPSIEGGVRPDALGVLRIDTAAGTCRLLSIPRDTLAPLPGYGQGKINHGYHFGGVELQRQAVSAFLGIEIDRYAAIDMRGFELLVEAVGGITVPEPERFEMTYGEGSYAYASSPQRLNGDQALAYSRYRYGEDGDFGRVRRQQQLIRSFLASTADLDVAAFIRETAPALAAHTRTDMSVAEMVLIGVAARDLCTAEGMEMATTGGAPALAWDDTFGQELWVVRADPAEVRRQAAWLMGGA